MSKEQVATWHKLFLLIVWASSAQSPAASSLSQSWVTLQQWLLHFGGFSFCPLINESFSASKQYQPGKRRAWNVKARPFWHINSGTEPHHWLKPSGMKLAHITQSGACAEELGSICTSAPAQEQSAALKDCGMWFKNLETGKKNQSLAEKWINGHDILVWNNVILVLCLFGQCFWRFFWYIF